MKSRFPRKEIFARLESQFENLSGLAFKVRYCLRPADYSCREKVKGIIPTVINLSCCPPAGYPCDNSLTERQEANEKTEKAIKKGELCYVGFVKQNLFQIVFGSVEPDQTIRVTFKYFVPLGPSLELRLPFSFLPKLLTNPGTVDQNKPIRGGMSVTVKYPEYISGITDMKTNQPLELDVNSSQQELNLHWKFNVKKQFDDQSTRVSVFEFSEIVPQTSHLWGKVGVVIDHRIELQPTQLRNHNLQFMVDFSSAMSDDFKQAIATAISEYVEGLDSSEGISVICFGRSSSSWPADTTTLRNWFSTMRDQQFGKLDTGSLAQKLGDMYQSPYNNSPRQIILITNTKPLDYRDVTQVINGARAIDTEHNRTFAIGIDDVSMSLCEDISQQTGGKAEFCCNHLTFAGYLQKQVSRALSKPSFRLSEFNVSVTGIDPQMVRDPSDFIDSGFNTVQLGSHIFGGLPTVDIGSDLEGCVAHIQTGLILEEFDHLETKPIVKLDVAIESLETEELLRTADNFTAEVHEAQPVNVSFYNYVKSTLEKRLQLGGANLERSIIDLSKTTSVLCSKTSFFGIRLSRSREPDQSAAEETNGKRARFGKRLYTSVNTNIIFQETDQDYQSTDMHRYHINSDYSETGAFGRDAGAHTENANNRSGRVFPEPAGHSEIPPKKDNIRRDLEALKVRIILKVWY